MYNNKKTTPNGINFWRTYQPFANGEYAPRSSSQTYSLATTHIHTFAPAFHAQISAGVTQHH